MKTAISLPDATFEAATRRAHDLGISRSEFFAVAAQRYLDHLDATSLTSAIDTALGGTTADGSSTAAVRAGRSRLLAADAW